MPIVLVSTCDVNDDDERRAAEAAGPVASVSLAFGFLHSGSTCCVDDMICVSDACCWSYVCQLDACDCVQCVSCDRYHGMGVCRLSESIEDEI